MLADGTSQNWKSSMNNGAKVALLILVAAMLLIWMFVPFMAE